MRRFLAVFMAVLCLIACTRSLTYWHDGKPGDDPATPLVEGGPRFEFLSLLDYVSIGAPDVTYAFQQILGGGAQWRPLGDFVDGSVDSTDGILQRLLDTVKAFFSWLGFAFEYLLNTIVGAFYFALEIVEYIANIIWYIFTAKPLFLPDVPQTLSISL